jgi:autotransporter-associated beta strand protein
MGDGIEFNDIIQTAVIQTLKSPEKMANTPLKPGSVRFFELHEKKIALFLCLLAAIHVFIFSAGFPFFNNVDEQMQVDLVLRYARGEMPKKIDFISTNSATYLGLMSSAEYLKRSGGFLAPVWTLPPTEWRLAWTARSDAWQTLSNYEISQPPLYYVLGALWWHIGKWVGLGDGQLVYWLRFLNVVLISGLVWLAYATARLLFPDRAFVRLGVPAFLVFMPQTSFYAIENDVLSPLAFGGTFYFLIKWLRTERPSTGLGIALGLAAAATLLSKMTNIPLLMIAVIVVLFKAGQDIRRGKWQEQARAQGWLFVCAGLPALVWITWCEVNFGDATGTAPRSHFWGWTIKPFGQWWHHPIYSAEGLWTFLSGNLGTFWQGEVWWHGVHLRLPGTDVLYTLLSLGLLAAALPGLLSRSSDSTLAQTRVLQLALACFIADLAFYGLMSTVYDFHDCFYPSPSYPYFTSGRLLLGALIPFLLVFVYGLNRVLSPWGRTFKFVLLIALIAAMLGLEIFTCRVVFGSPYNWFHLPHGGLMPASPLQASCLYWDPQADNSQFPYLGNLSGAWEHPSWSSASAGQATPTHWTEGTAVCFGTDTGLNTPPFTVLMNSNHTVAALYDGSLSPNSCEVTVYGSGVMTLPSGLDVFAIHNASDGSLGIVTISNTIAGPGVLNLQNEGQLYLCGSNTWAGGMSLGYGGAAWEGTLYFNTANAFGLGTIYSSNCLNGSLVMKGSSSLVITNPMVFSGALNLVGGSLGLTFAGPWTLVQSLTLGVGDPNGTNRVTIAGVIGGTIPGRGGLTIMNSSAYPGILTLAANNIYKGDTRIASGILAIGPNGSISNTPTILVERAGTFDVSAVSPFNLNAGQTLEGSGTVTGDVSVGSGADLAGGTAIKIGTLTITGSLLLQSGGTNIVYIQNAQTGAGVGNSSLNVGKNIGVLATRSRPFIIKLVSLTDMGAAGMVSNFDRTMSYRWILATGTTTHFDPADFVVDISAFAHRTAAGTFSVSHTDSALILNYKP